MFLIYKILTVGLILSVLFYYFHVPYVYLYVITVVIAHNEETVRYSLWALIWNINLKVRDNKLQFQLISDKKAYATLRHSTPIMQNSFTSTTGSEYKSGLFNGVTSTPLSSPTSYMQNSLFQRTRLTPLRSPPL